MCIMAYLYPFLLFPFTLKHVLSYLYKQGEYAEMERIGWHIITCLFCLPFSQLKMFQLFVFKGLLSGLFFGFGLVGVFFESGFFFFFFVTYEASGVFKCSRAAKTKSAAIKTLGNILFMKCISSISFYSLRSVRALSMCVFQKVYIYL